MLLHPEVYDEGTPERRRWMSKFRHGHVVFSEKNRQAYWHYQQCKAVGVFPDGDAIVRRNAAIIAGVLKAVDDLRLDRLFHLLGGRL